MSDKPLFRRESEQARSTAWLGRILLIRPVSFALLTGVALGMALALIAFFAMGEYTRKARVVGVLAPAHGVVRIVAQQSGIVESVRVREGEPVTRETTLFVIGDGRVNHRNEDVGSAVALRLADRHGAIRRQRDSMIVAANVERAALNHRTEALSHEVQLIDAEIAVQLQRAAISAQGLARARRLEEIGFLSGAALDHEKDGALDQEMRVETMRRARLALTRELSTAAFELQAAGARAHAQLASVDVQAAALEQEILEREVQYNASIVAPTDGLVAAVLVEAGQMVVQGTTLATILPANDALEAHLYSPSRSIGFVRAGQVVLLRYLAYPHQKFGSHKARVIAVSRNPLAPGELGYAPADGSREPVYRIKVALGSQTVAAYGRGEPLQPGMQVEADILLDRRRLIEWIFEPLLSLAGRA
jgi:membrane fusion protein